MSKAEEFIKEYTRNCSNIIETINRDKNVAVVYQPWLTPDDALRAVEIARKEVIGQTVEWLTKHAIKYYINSKGFLGTDELVKDYVHNII